MTSWSRSIRSSYSTPSAFICRDRLAARLVLLGGQDLPRVVERRLHDGDHVQRVGGGFGVQQLEGGQREGGQRLVEREVLLEVDGQPDDPALGVRLVQPLDDAAVQQRAVDRDGPADVPQLRRARSSWLSSSSCRIASKALPGRAITDSSIAWVTRKREVSGSGSEAISFSKVFCAPVDEALGRLLADHLAALLRVVARLGERLLVLDDVLGRLRDDEAGGVEAGPPGPARRSGGTPAPAASAPGCRRTWSAR